MKNEKPGFWILNSGAALLTLAGTVAALMLTSLLNPVIPGKPGIIVFLSLALLGLGVLYTKIFQESGAYRKIVAGITGSTALALLAAYSKIVYSSIQGLSLTVGKTPTTSPGLAGIINTESMIHPELFFTALMISFNLPILYSWSRGERKLEHLLLYLIPIAAFLIVPAIFSGLLSGI